MHKITQNYWINNMISALLTAPRTHLNCDDLTPNQKVLLYDIMQRHEATKGFAYDRFFKEGFDPWEMMGVDAIKRSFLTEHATDIFPEHTDGVEALINDIIVLSGEFWRTLGRIPGLKKDFKEYMASLSMCETAVVANFTTDNFREFQRIGINAIISEFEREVAALPGGEVKNDVKP